MLRKLVGCSGEYVDQMKGDPLNHTKDPSIWLIRVRFVCVRGSLFSYYRGNRCNWFWTPPLKDELPAAASCRAGDKVGSPFPRSWVAESCIAPAPPSCCRTSDGRHQD